YIRRRDWLIVGREPSWVDNPLPCLGLPWRPVPGAGIEAGDQIGQRQITVDVMAYLYLAASRQNGTTWIWRAVRQCKISVGQDDSEQKKEVRVLDQLGHRRIAGRAEVGSGEDVACRFQQTPSHEGCDHRQAELARQRRDLLLDPVAPTF